jgi:TatD DNase family protein
MESRETSNSKPVSRLDSGAASTTDPVLIDSHCHIDMRDFDDDREEVVTRAKEAGVETMLVVAGLDGAGGHRRALEMAERWRLVASAGLHPHEARLGSEALYGDLRALAESREIVAIGEIGLDFHYDHSPRAAQVEAFRRQVRLAREVGLPVIVHSREADEETADLLEREGGGELRGVIHCFTGSERLARRALALGFFISFSGIVAFPKAEPLRGVARSVPLDRLLVETDAPFLAPPPHRGKRNEPAFVVEVARALAAARGESFEAVAEATRRSFAVLFGCGPV